MPKVLSKTIRSAITQDHTKPIYLIRIGWATETRSATWGSEITWNGELWSPSGIEVANLTGEGGTLVFPNGSTDPWLALVLGEGQRGKSVSIYEWQEDTTASPQADAHLLFAGIMDEAQITVSAVRVTLLESSTTKRFPPNVIDDDFNYLLPAGTRIAWGGDTVVVNG